MRRNGLDARDRTGGSETRDDEEPEERLRSGCVKGAAWGCRVPAYTRSRLPLFCSLSFLFDSVFSLSFNVIHMYVYIRDY